MVSGNANVMCTDVWHFVSLAKFFRSSLTLPLSVQPVQLPR